MIPGIRSIPSSASSTDASGSTDASEYALFVNAWRHHETSPVAEAVAAVEKRRSFRPTYTIGRPWVCVVHDTAHGRFFFAYRMRTEMVFTAHAAEDLAVKIEHAFA